MRAFLTDDALGRVGAAGIGWLERVIRDTPGAEAWRVDHEGGLHVRGPLPLCAVLVEEFPP